MPRRAAGLTAAKVRTAAPGRYGDGNGLYLLVRSLEARFWLFRYTREGKMREMGLGPASGRAAVSLVNARDKARQLYDSVRSGRDPLADRAEAEATAKLDAARAAAREATFRDAAQAYIAAHQDGWRNAKHAAQWPTTLDQYAYPYMGNLAVGAVETRHVMAALEPIWRTRPETASRLRGRIEAVLDYAKARGWRTGENPARWRGHVENMLPPRSKIVQVVHHPALPWREMASFLAQLRTQQGLGARALEFTILTAARSSETLNARWRELDLDRAVWTVPADRMKARREHRVPLAPETVALLRAIGPMDQVSNDGWVFPGLRQDRPLSNMAMLMVLRRMGRTDLTTHGFRSSFRDWCAEATDHSREVAEAALAHTLGDKVEAAYRRGDLFEKRRKLMEEWSAFCNVSAESTFWDASGRQSHS